MPSNNHQDVRVVSAESTLEVLNKLREVKIKKKKQVKSVAITLALAEPFSEEGDVLVSLFEVVPRCFPKLKSLEIRSEIEDQNFEVPAKVLTALLHPNKGLKRLVELSLQGLSFSGNDKDFRMLVKAISLHSSLDCCELYETSMANLATGLTGMETVVSALSEKLEKLVISSCRLAPGEARFWSASSLVKLCRSTKLKEVRIHNIKELAEEHIVLMSQELQTNKTLRKLSLLKYEEDPAIDTANDGNNQSKKSKKSKGKQAPAPVETLSSEAGALAIANMLRVNKSLEEISLSAFDFNEYSAMFFGNALEADNDTLQHIWLLVPTNTGGMSSFPPDDPRLDYFLRLNRAGRQKVVTLLKTEEREGDDSSRAEWVESLVSSNRDIDVSFFFLSKKPSLCQV